MSRNPKRSSRTPKTDFPDHPIISDTSHRDTLDRVADIIELLQQVNLSDGLTPNARAGLYWIHHMLADSIKHVSDELRQPPNGRTR